MLRLSRKRSARFFLRGITHKKASVSLVVAAAATLLAFGLVSGIGRPAMAAAARDCSDNSIDNKDINGGCGAANPQEFIADLRDNNPGDLQTIYADSRIGLPSSLYDDFASNAQEGAITRGGNLVVAGQTVGTDVWTMGRTTLGGKQPTAIVIGGNTYFHSPPSASFGDGVESIPTMVLFDKNGVVQAAVMNPCGNPVTKINKRKPAAECKALNKVKVDGKDNTFQFNTTVSLDEFGLAKVVKLEYFIDEGNGPKLFDTETNPQTLTPAKTFTTSATVTVKVTVSLPGGNSKTITSDLCVQKIEVKKKEVPPPKPTPTPTPTPTPKPQVLPSATVKQPPVIPVTGPAGMPGLFVGTTLMGTIGHRLYSYYRRRRR
ncbi:MAG TPA: hypothetical protein VL737_05050 [Candidatus Pristimantibacillus sp.]|nr:hypothetical protein [Candidatus Pristimantibacillus sp.]